jgi:hypothetical protein
VLLPVAAAEAEAGPSWVAAAVSVRVEGQLTL